MSLADYTLLLLIILFAVYCLYDEMIVKQLKGRTLLVVVLKRSNRIDGFIFIGLIAILLYTNTSQYGSSLTNYLLSTLIILGIYTFFVRRQKLILKESGFFFANIFIAYDRISEMKLSETGTLLITLESRSIAINVNDLNDLERIYSAIKATYLD